MVCHYSYFFCRFKFQNSACTFVMILTMLCPSLRDIAIITVNGVDFCCVIHGIGKSQAIPFVRKFGT